MQQLALRESTVLVLNPQFVLSLSCRECVWEKKWKKAIPVYLAERWSHSTHLECLLVSRKWYCPAGRLNRGFFMTGTRIKLPAMIHELLRLFLALGSPRLTPCIRKRSEKNYLYYRRINTNWHSPSFLFPQSQRDPQSSSCFSTILSTSTHSFLLTRYKSHRNPECTFRKQLPLPWPCWLCPPSSKPAQSPRPSSAMPPRS